jgi:mRNA-degrading endonuclease RelE of RelBE toxin-antitoxin system
MNNPSVQVDLSTRFLKDSKRLEKKYRHLADDVERLIEQLENGETPGDQIPGVGYTAYKVRLKSSDLTKGKAGGFRVIYYIKTETRILLLTIYAKSEQTDISPDDIAAIIRDEELPDNGTTE